MVNPRPDAASSPTAAGSLISDGQICLRPLAVEDVDAHLDGCDRIIIDRLSGGKVSTRGRTHDWLEQNAQAWTSAGYVVDLGIEDDGTGLLAGCVGIQRGLDYLQPRQVNLTYAVYPQWRGRRYAARAVSLAMQLETQRRPVSQFVIRASPENPESIAVALRAGFVHSHLTDDQHGKLLWLERVP